MMRYLLMVCLILFTSTVFAGNDIAATYKYKDGNTVTLLTRDKEHVRMDVSPENYMLLQKGKIYSLSKDEDGNWIAMDMNQMKAMTSGGLAGLMAGGKLPAAAQDKEYTVKYEKTGKKEQIAGYSGIVYNVTTMEGGKVVSQDEIVLCSHDDLKKVNEAWTAVATGMGGLMGEKSAGSLEKATKEASAAGYGGMLRYGEEMKLDSLKKQALDSATYEVPPNAQIMNLGAMPGMPQGMMNQMPKN